MKNFMRSVRPNAKPNGKVDPDKFVEKLRTGYDKYNTVKPMQKKTFSPSRVGYRKGEGSCARYWYIAWNGVEEWNDSHSSISWALMKNGILAHERLQDLFKKSDIEIIDIEREATHGDPPIRGFIDVVVDRAGEEVPVEIKTTRTEAFKSHQRKNDASGYHKVQVLLYMYATDTDNAVIVYEDRNTMELLAIPVSKSENQEQLDILLDWMRRVRKAYEDDTLPLNKFTWDNPVVCRGCPVKEQCFDMPEGEVDIEQLPKLW